MTNNSENYSSEPALVPSCGDQLIEFSVITSEVPETLTKQYKFTSGKLTKITVANMRRGSATLQRCSFKDFGDVLTRLRKNQALCYGVTGHDSIAICTKKEFEDSGKPENVIPRTNEYFSYPSGSGILMVDYDPASEGSPLCKQQLEEQLFEACSVLRECARFWYPSSSSHIFLGDDDQTGLRGQRIYVLVVDAVDIPRAGNVLAERLWLTGYGRYEVSVSGQLLERTTIDTSVWQSNRLDFAAGADCTHPLDQQRGEPVYFSGVALDTKLALPDLTLDERERLVRIKAEAKTKVRGEATAIQQRYVEEKASEICTEHTSVALNDAKKLVNMAVENQTLAGDFPIPLENGEIITVEQALANPSEYHGKETFDPIEPGYSNHKVTGKLFLLDGRPCLHSFAHGGRTFKLIREPERIEIIQGKRIDAVNQTLEVMRAQSDIYDMGDILVIVEDGVAHRLDIHRLTHTIGSFIQYWAWKKQPRQDAFAESLRNPDQQICNQILSLGPSRNLKQLDAVITAPTMRPDGSIITNPGYDETTRLYLHFTDKMPPVPDEPTHDEVIAALSELMRPFADFPFCRPVDKGVFLAALLTAVVRPVLPTAPAFAFDAPVQGSGKTLLAKCLYILTENIALSEHPKVWPHTKGKDDEEIRKRLLTALVDAPSAIIWDNVLGEFDSASLAAFITSPTFSDRMLGKTKQITVPNRVLFMMTGNNLLLSGDMPRRVMKCRIDPDSERPYAREFDLNPEDYVKRNRLRLVAAALTLLRGWYTSDMKNRDGRAGNGRMASFESWDDMVRQPVAWVAKYIDPDNYADPMEAVDLSQASDPEQDQLRDLYESIYDAFGEMPFMAKELHQKAGNAYPCGEELKEAIRSFTGSDPTTRSLGRILSNRKDRIVDGKKLVELSKSSKSKRACRYKLVQVE